MGKVAQAGRGGKLPCCHPGALIDRRKRGVEPGQEKGKGKTSPHCMADRMDLRTEGDSLTEGSQ